MTNNLVRVVAAVILNEQGEFLLSSRPEGKAYAGYWEFAGGKVEAGESELQALQRELHEELGLDILAATPWLTKVHHYEHASVHLRFFRVLPHQWQGQLQCKERQSYSWQQAGRFDVSPMLPANGPILRALSLPLEWDGDMTRGWQGVNGIGPVSMGFDKKWDVNLLAADESIDASCQGLQLQCLSDIHQLAAYDGDGWWWQATQLTEVDALLAALYQGCAVPVVALLPKSNHVLAQRLQAAGVHVAHCEGMEALLT